MTLDEANNHEGSGANEPRAGESGLEAQVRSALQERADAFEPSAGAYTDLRRRVASEGAGSTQQRSVASRLLVAAASLAVLGGAGLIAVQRTATVAVDVAVPSTLDGAIGVDPVENAPDDADGGGSDDAEQSGGDDSAAVESVSPLTVGPAPDDFVLGPRAATWEAASLQFLELIQRPSERALLEADGAVVHVSARAESGELRPVADLELGTVTLADDGTGYVVVAASSPTIVIEEPMPLTRTTDPTLEVSGRGSGFEATIGLQLYSGDDGVKLATRFAQGGNYGELAPFGATVPVAGAEWAWVVAESTTGTTAGIAEFAAVPVWINAPLPIETYAVSAIPADDPDGGLWVRNLPGTDGEKLVLLPTGLDDIRTRGLPSTVGDQEWWNVLLPEPNETGRKAGWVSSRHLTRSGEVAEPELMELAGAFVGAYKAGGVDVAELPWSDRRPVHVGWSGGLVPFSATDLASYETWDAERSWVVPEERFGTPTTTASLRQVVDALGSDPTESEFSYDYQALVGTDPAVVSPYGLDQAVLRSMFAGTTWVQIADPGADGSEWQTTTLFVEPGDSGAVIVGVVVTYWIP